MVVNVMGEVVVDPGSIPGASSIFPDRINLRSSAYDGAGVREDTTSNPAPCLQKGV